MHKVWYSWKKKISMYKMCRKFFSNWGNFSTQCQKDSVYFGVSRRKSFIKNCSWSALYRWRCWFCRIVYCDGLSHSGPCSPKSWFSRRRHRLGTFSYHEMWRRRKKVPCCWGVRNIAVMSLEILILMIDDGLWKCRKVKKEKKHRLCIKVKKWKRGIWKPHMFLTYGWKWG